MKKIVVIGGGASGMMAAIVAARKGAKVTLLEKNKQVGKKLLVTGNGKCNFSNQNQDLSFYRCEYPTFVQKVLETFSMEDTKVFFEELGILIKERNGGLYPNSGQAASMVEVLRLELQRLQVKVACNTEVLQIEKKEETFFVKTQDWTYEADSVILSCGSKAAPTTGASEAGYQFAKSFGHSIITPLPALTSVYVKEKDAPKLAGIRQDALLYLDIEGESIQQEIGEVQFTSYGLSGIPVFQLSRYVARALDKGKSCEMSLDFLPQMQLEDIVKLLTDKRTHTGNRTGSDVLLGMFPEKLSVVLLERARISAKKKAKDWSEKETRQLAMQIKALKFTLTKCRGYEQAQICTGGVDLLEIEEHTMESKLVRGLYVSGELLDVDGACGGYNLQWAWSSGYLAGYWAAGQ